MHTLIDWGPGGSTLYAPTTVPAIADTAETDDPPKGLVTVFATERYQSQLNDPAITELYESNGFHIELRFRAPTAGSNVTLVYWGTTNISDAHVGFKVVYTSTGTLALWTRSTASTFNSVALTAAALSPGNFYHVSLGLTRDSGGWIVSRWLNGTSLGSDVTIAFGELGTSNRFAIAQRLRTPGGNAMQFVGQMGPVRLCKRPLTSDEVLRSYQYLDANNRFNYRDGLTASAWQLATPVRDETTTFRLYTEIGVNGEPYTETRPLREYGPTLSAESYLEYDDGLVFAGTPLVGAASEELIDLVVNGSYRVQFWAKFSPGVMRIISLGSPSVVHGFLIQHTGTGSLIFRSYDGPPAAAFRDWEFSGLPAADGEWHHYCFNVTRLTGIGEWEVELIFDGVSQGSDILGMANNLLSTNINLVFGGYYVTSIGPFTGTLGYVEIGSGALSEADALINYSREDRVIPLASDTLELYRNNVHSTTRMRYNEAASVEYDEWRYAGPEWQLVNQTPITFEVDSIYTDRIRYWGFENSVGAYYYEFRPGIKTFEGMRVQIESGSLYNAKAGINAYDETGLPLIVELLPPGRAWKLGEFFRTLVGAWARELSRATRLIGGIVDEIFPATADGTLENWERMYGIPDACGALGETVEQRQSAVLSRHIGRTNGNPQDLILIAENLGYVGATVVRMYDPLTCISECTDALYGQEGGWAWAATLVVPFHSENDAILECEIRKLAQAFGAINIEYSDTV